MKEHLIGFQEAVSKPAMAAAYLAENIGSSDGHAEALQEIVAYFISKDAVDFAAELANTVKDSFERDNLLVRVAEKCAATGDDEYAAQLAEAVEDFNLQATARERIALQKAARGEFDEALKIAGELSHPSDALAEIAVRRATGGDNAGFRETLARVEFPAAKVHALQAVAAHFRKTGAAQKVVELLAEAAREAELIELPEEKIRALLSVAAFYIDIKGFDKAIETLAQARASAEILESAHRESFLSSISLDFLRADSLDLADRALDLIADKTMIASTLTGFSAEFEARGEHSEALDALEEAYAIIKSQKDREVRDTKARFNLLGAIAVRFAALDKIERAIGVALENPLQDEREGALAQIAQFGFAKENEALARQAIASIENDSERIFALISAGNAEKRAGNTEKAKNFLDEASEIAAGILQIGARLSAFNRLAACYFALGDAAKARLLAFESLRNAGRILDESHRSIALLKVAETYEKCGFELNEAEKQILQTIILKAEK